MTWSLINIVKRKIIIEDNSKSFEVKFNFTVILTRRAFMKEHDVSVVFTVDTNPVYAVAIRFI